MSDRKAEILKKLETLEVRDPARAALEQELQEIEATEQAMSAINLRFQEQEEKVQSLTLPYDFNKLYDDTTANETIIEVVQLFMREANTEHNNEVQGLIDAHREEMRAASDRELQLKRQNVELQSIIENGSAENKELIRQNGDYRDHIAQITLERDDALSKRDAAVREKEGIELLLTEKDAHIQTLRDEMAIGASRAINVTEVKASDRLAALVEQSKSAKIKSSIELALERTEPIRGKIDVVAPPKALEDATFPTQAGNTANIGLDNVQVSGVPANDQEVTFPLPHANAPEVPSLGTTMVAGQPETETNNGVTKAEFEERLSQFAQEFGLVKGQVAQWDTIAKNQW